MSFLLFVGVFFPLNISCIIRGLKTLNYLSPQLKLPVLLFILPVLPTQITGAFKNSKLITEF